MAVKAIHLRLERHGPARPGNIGDRTLIVAVDAPRRLRTSGTDGFRWYAGHYPSQASAAWVKTAKRRWAASGHKSLVSKLGGASALPTIFYFSAPLAAWNENLLGRHRAEPAFEGRDWLPCSLLPREVRGERKLRPIISKMTRRPCLYQLPRKCYMNNGR